MRRSSATAELRPAARFGADHEETVVCSRCGLAAVWGALVRTKVLEGAALESYLSVPPDGWFVDVRVCTGCGRSLARKVRARQPPSDGV